MLIPDLRRFYERSAFEAGAFVRDPHQRERLMLYKVYQIGMPLSLPRCLDTERNLQEAIELAGLRV